MYYFVRKNMSFALPSLEAEYGITKASFGIIMTLGGLIYGVSKFINGNLADRVNARWHLIIGLTICVLSSVLFGYADELSIFFTGTTSGGVFIRGFVAAMSVLYITNQIFQGCGFAPCNRLMVSWVPPKELATKMSVWNTSHSIGAGILAVICGTILAKMGTDQSVVPETFLTVAGNLEIDVQGLLGELSALNLLGTDGTLTDVDLVNIKHVLPSLETTKPELYKNLGEIFKYTSHVGAWRWCFWIPAAIAGVGIIFNYITLRDTPKSVGLPELPKVKGEIDEKEDKNPKAYRSFLMERVFKNPVIWVLAITDLFVYIVRFAILDWGPSMLTEMGMSQSLTGWTVAIFELAGCAGMLCAGLISDKLFKSKSQRVCAIEMGLVAICLVALHFLQDANRPILFLVILAIAGFLIYGPQALIGVTAANVATKRAASTAVGLIGFMSYLSTIITGAGFGYLADKFGGWGWIFITMGGLSTVGAVLIMSIWGIKEGSGE